MGSAIGLNAYHAQLTGPVTKVIDTSLLSGQQPKPHVRETQKRRDPSNNEPSEFQRALDRAIAGVR